VRQFSSGVRPECVPPPKERGLPDGKLLEKMRSTEERPLGINSSPLGWGNCSSNLAGGLDMD